MTRLLIVESNTPDLVAQGRANARPFLDTLPRLRTELEMTVTAPYEAPLDPGKLAEMDGVIFTGSSVDWCVTDPQETPLVAAMEAVFSAGLPVWGSCNGMQLAAVLLGGHSAASPNGMENGVARAVTLTEAGKRHPMMVGRDAVFEVLCIHRDEVTALPAGAVLLAGNAHSPVQAFAYETGGVDFWGTQYHPEYSAGFLAGAYQNKTEHQVLAETLKKAGHDRDAAQDLGTRSEALTLPARATELLNWLDHVQVKAGIAHADVT